MDEAEYQEKKSRLQVEIAEGKTKGKSTIKQQILLSALIRANAMKKYQPKKLPIGKVVITKKKVIKK